MTSDTTPTTTPRNGGNGDGDTPEVSFPAADAKEAFTGHRITLLLLLLAAVGVGLAVGVAASTVVGAVAGAIIGLTAAFAGAAVVWIPWYGGDHADRALSRSARSAWQAIRGRTRRASPYPTLGVTADGHTAQQLEDAAPPEFDGMRFLQALTPDQRLVAVLHDTWSDGYTAVMRIRPLETAALDGAVFAQMMTSWEQLLAASAAPVIRRVQVVQVSCPDADGAEMHRYLAGHGVGIDGDADDDYRRLLAGVGPSSTVHEAHIAVQVSGQVAAGRAGIGRRRRANRDAAAVQALLAELARIAEHAGRVGVDIVNNALSPRELATVWRTIYAPYDRPDINRRDDRVGDDEAGVSWQGAFPYDSDDAHPDYYRTDATWHTGWWVEAFPARAHGRFLEPTLLSPTVPRVFAVVMEPLSAAGERQRAGAERMRADVSQRDRDRKDWVTSTARADRDRQVQAYDREVHDRWQPFVMSCYLVASAAAADDVGGAVEQIRDAASDSGLELRRARRVQRAVFGFVLPGMMRGVGGHRGRATLTPGGER